MEMNASCADFFCAYYASVKGTCNPAEFKKKIDSPVLWWQLAQMDSDKDY